MPSELLTDKRIKAIRPPKTGRLEIWDAKETGLILRISASGTKTWALQFKTNEYDAKGRRKTRKMKLGDYGGGVGLKEARVRAKRALTEIDDGIDPAEIRFEEKAAAIEAGKRRNAATIAEAVEAFAALTATDPSTWKRIERPRILRRELSDHHGRKGVGSVTVAHLKSHQKKIHDRPAPVMANRFAAAARVFFKWAADEYGVENPATELGLITDERQIERDRYLSIDELRAIWTACSALSPVSRDFVRVLMLTPQRRNAVVQMRFSQIDVNGNWTIPRTQKKSKSHAQVLPLSRVAQAIIDERRGQSGRYVFSSGRAGDAPLQAPSKIKRQIDSEIGDEIAPWRFHDFRRSFSTWAASAGIAQPVTRKILDHGQGRRDRLDAIYNRFEYLDEQRSALNEYAKAVMND